MGRKLIYDVDAALVRRKTKVRRGESNRQYISKTHLMLEGNRSICNSLIVYKQYQTEDITQVTCASCCRIFNRTFNKGPN